MGICVCNKKYKNKKKKNSINNNDKINKKNILIENQTDMAIIKQKGEIKGTSIKISSNTNCIILILDYSSSIQIQNCENCSFLLSPCSSSIQIRNCQKINVISAASQIHLKNIRNGNFFSYTNTPLAIESSKNICLGIFFVQYTELPELFYKSDLNIWNNRWSQYNEFGKNENIFYDNDETKNNIIEELLDIFNEHYINYDLYQFLPFTYGKSINLYDMIYKNILIVFRAEDLCEEELLKQLTPEELEERKIIFLSSLVLQENINNYDKIVEKIKKNTKNEELLDFLNNNSNNYKYTTLSKNSDVLNLTKGTQRGKLSSKLNEMDLTGTLGYGDTNRKSLLRGDILLLWFISDCFEIDEFQNYIQSLYEKGAYGWITNDDIGSEESDFQELLFSIFFKENPENR